MRLPMKLPLHLVIYAVILNCKVFGEEEVICPSLDEIVFLASSKSCSEYYMCFGGSPIAMTCFDDLHFNVAKQSCDLPKLAQCTIVEATATEGKTSVRPPTHTQSSVKASPTPVILHTQKPTPPAFVPAELKTTSPPLTTSTALSSTQSISTLATFTSRPLTESTGLPSTQSPSTQAPFTSLPLTESSVLPSTQSPSTLATSTSRPFKKTTVLPPTPNALVPSSDVKTQCEVKLVGYFIYPEDCHFYYRCLNGVLRLQECPWGHGFDVNKKACNFSGCSTQGK